MELALPVFIIFLIVGWHGPGKSSYRAFKLASRLIRRKRASKIGINSGWAKAVVGHGWLPMFHLFVRSLGITLATSLGMMLMFTITVNPKSDYYLYLSNFLESLIIACWAGTTIGLMLSTFSNLAMSPNFLDMFKLTFLNGIGQNAKGEAKVGTFAKAVSIHHSRSNFKDYCEVMLAYLDAEELEKLVSRLKKEGLQDLAEGLKIEALAHLPHPDFRQLSKSELESAIGHFKLNLRQYLESLGLIPGKFRGVQVALHEVDRVIQRFAPCFAHSDALYCESCKVRPRLREYGPWHWPECPSCKSWLNIRTDAKVVVGILGNSDSEAQPGEFLVLLSGETALPPFIDRLQINHDPQIELEVARFLSQVNNSPLSRNQKFEIQIADGLELDPNLMRQLEQHRQTIVKNGTD